MALRCQLRPCSAWRAWCLLALAALLPGSAGAGARGKRPAVAAPLSVRVEPLRRAIADLMDTFGAEYPHGKTYLARLDALARKPGAQTELRALQREALLANPRLRGLRLLVVKRRPKSTQRIGFGFPSNHECNASLPRTGWHNEIAVLSSLDGNGTLTTLHRPKDGGWVGEVDLHWDASRLLFTQSDRTSWKVWEAHLAVQGTSVKGRGTRGKKGGDRAVPFPSPDPRPPTLVPSSLRQVSHLPSDVDAFDACYLPDGRIVFGSTASYQSVPCWHGARHVSNLYIMNADGSGVRQLCFDQDHDFHPVVNPDGQVLYHRWDYTGINHIFLRQLMLMNPDGTGQRAVYGSNSWFP
ncbi:MAG: hypothetical protein ISS72_06195, partial [Candidatus Brocadiae bacterium]|nr:hypothetical protein [Candidatus Brocadiia bacterium]